MNRFVEYGTVPFRYVDDSNGYPSGAKAMRKIAILITSAIVIAAGLSMTPAQAYDGRSPYGWEHQGSREQAWREMEWRRHAWYRHHWYQSYYHSGYDH
jgi:hypothetical protein